MDVTADASSAVKTVPIGDACAAVFGVFVAERRQTCPLRTRGGVGRQGPRLPSLAQNPEESCGNIGRCRRVSGRDNASVVSVEEIVSLEVVLFGTRTRCSCCFMTDCSCVFEVRNDVTDRQVFI